MTDVITLYEGRFLRLLDDCGWEYVVRTNATGVVIIVAVTSEGELLLVEQYRAPVDNTVIELPAGLVGDIAGEEHESLRIAATRELEEETGYRAARMTLLTQGPPSAGLTSEQMTFYRAHDLAQTGVGGGDDSENITVHKVPLAESARWLAECQAMGILVDPKVYVGLYFLAQITV